MSAKDVVDLLGRLKEAGIDAWLDGGWAVDAALETQTRPHDDLDLVVELRHVEELQELLGKMGYVLAGGGAPKSFELTDDEGRQVDVHPVVLSQSGDGIYLMDNGEACVYPAAGFAGTGRVLGRRVRCLTPEVQMLCHTGYEPHLTSFDDVWALSRRFNIPVPEEYRGPPESYAPRDEFGASADLPSMTPADNKELVRRFYEEAWGRGELDVIDEVFAEDYVRHDLRPGDPPPGPRGMRQITADFRAAFPDLRFEVDIVMADGDFVASRWTASGTNTGPWGGMPATGRAATFSGVNIFRFENGKVAEIWNHRDDLGLREQLGAPIYAGAASQRD